MIVFLGSRSCWMHTKKHWNKSVTGLDFTNSSCCGTMWLWPRRDCRHMQNFSYDSQQLWGLKVAQIAQRSVPLKCCHSVATAQPFYKLDPISSFAVLDAVTVKHCSYYCRMAKIIQFTSRGDCSHILRDHKHLEIMTLNVGLWLQAFPLQV